MYDKEGEQITKTEAEFYVEIDSYGETFKRCVLFLNKEKGMPTKLIAKDVKDGKSDDVIKKYKHKLDNTKYGGSGKHTTKKELFDLVNAYPELLKPFLGIENPFIETDLAVLKREVENLKKAVNKQDDDIKGLYKLIIKELK